ncbi:MAG TPA: hypothetical protein VFZ59_04740 [Verrucomicrobiae bacterium]|nr:hypothetical protein [Verrucomicrobiae bacterium]
MKTKSSLRRAHAGSALALTMIMTAIALAILASAMSWSVNSTRLTHRSVQYTRAIAAAEAGTEKVVTRITRDFLTGGDKLVMDNAASYRLAVPTASDSSYWGDWEFNDASGQTGRTFVEAGNATNYVVLNSDYSGLRAFVSSYRVVSHARETTAAQDVPAGVLQEVRLARIPVFQFALYSSSDMEISCGQPFRVTGRVHANDRLFVEPDNALTFQSDVTAVTSILFERHPLDTRGKPAGSAVYEHPELKKSPVSPMTLPIGTTNTPEAIREIVQPPPAGEDPDSPLGRLRYFNQVNMVLTVSDFGVTATSGRADGFATAVPTNQLAPIVTTTNSFRDAREGKTVRPVDINVGALADWSRTNGSLKSISSVYVLDKRTLPGTQLAAVRLRNGTTLPEKGLTVATARPLYVLGNYNQTNAANLHTTNTATTRPASLVADAVTLLSVNWDDARSTSDLDSRAAKPTTVNAAILTGVVETTKGKYSGGMENFPRFLEKWGSANTLTYNGSMVKMFPSQYATNVWGLANVYDPPKRNWAYDLNFNDPAKLPPLTPSLLKVLRGQWATVPPGQTAVAANP